MPPQECLIRFTRTRVGTTNAHAATRIFEGFSHLCKDVTLVGGRGRVQGEQVYRDRDSRSDSDPRVLRPFTGGRKGVG